jgi:hypothetical protein
MAIKIGDTCKNGHIIEGENVQHYLNRGNPHVRCKACNKTPVVKKQIGDKCAHGHILEGANLLIRKTRGVESYACRICSLEASRRYRRSDKYMSNTKYVKNKESAEKIQRQVDAGLYGKAGVSYADMVKREDAIDKKIEKDSRANNLIPAMVNVDMNKRSRDSMQAMVSSPNWGDGLCSNSPEEYVDYDVEPTQKDAYWLCNGCPLLVECARFANANGPERGVWGGQIWRNGRIV